MIAKSMENRDVFSNPLVVLRQIAAGEQAAFKEIYTCFYKSLYQFALAIVRNREAAEEIVQNVFVKIWQRRTQILSIQNLRVYLYTATKNMALNDLSQKARENITEPFDHIHIELNGSVNTPEQIMITAETDRIIRQAVDALPPRCKMIFKLIREDGLKYKEVSQILNIAVNTIDVQMAIAVKRIAASLASEFGPVIRPKYSLK
jgi:RNA polymerase sigma-70 factor (family 1)